MYLSNQVKISRIKGAPSRSVTCSKCFNHTDQELVCWDAGANIRFAGLHVVGRRDYGYLCAICNTVSEKLTKDQALSLRAR